jgi:hypothetical protein
MLSSETIFVLPQGNLSFRARWFQLKLVLLVPLVHTYLKFAGYNRTLSLLRHLTPLSPACSHKPCNPETYAKIILRLMLHIRDYSLFPGNCLSRSLSLWWLLRRAGINSKLHIGTKYNSKQFRAHAWVEYQGHPLNAGNKVRQRYVAFDKAFATN